MFESTQNPLEIENTLSRALRQVLWIGELPLSEADFRSLAMNVRNATKLNVKLKPCTIATVMVFCARFAEYSDDEHVSYWDKFFRVVLDQPTRTVQDENGWRKEFANARDALQREYQFEFPTHAQTAQPYVSGIYLHAILPAYLQKEFAGFFIHQYPDYAAWAELNTLFPDVLAKKLESDSPPHVSVRLRRFLTSTETSLTAAKLIKSLATAAVWQREGMDAAAIRSVLSPIEAAVWDDLYPQLPHADVVDLQTVAEAPRVRQRWAWLVEQNDILELHVRNLRLTGTGEPDRLVWLPKDSLITVGAVVPDYGRAFCEVNAWRTSDGYIIDVATLIDIDQSGLIVPVDREDRALAAPIATPEPPGNGPAIFRIGTDDQLGILRGTEGLIDGEYAISLPPDVDITAGDGGSVTRLGALLVPKALAVLGHVRAARYALRLPVLIGKQLVPRQRSRTAPTINGERLVAGLLPGSLPVYENGDLWLDFSPPGGIALGRLSLRLTVNDQVRVLRLDDIEAAGLLQQITSPTGDLLRVRLTPYVSAPCLVQAEVFSGVARMHGEPRLAGLLPPGVSAVTDPVDAYYTVHHPPGVRVTGMRRDQVVLASDAHIDQADGTITVTWQDPRQDAALRLRFDDVELPLTFDIHWAHAWVEPLLGQHLFEDALSEAMLHVRGPRGVDYTIRVDTDERTYTLNARGVRAVSLREDPLADMLKQYHGERVSVHLTFGDRPAERLPLFTFIRPQFGDFERQPEVVKRAIRAFKSAPKYARRISDQPDRHLLLLTPHEYSDGLPIESLPEPLGRLYQVVASASPTAQALFPKYTRLLRFSSTSAFPLEHDDKGDCIHISRNSHQGQVMVRVGVIEAGNAVTLNAPFALRQCATCSELYWQDDTDARVIHSHGKFGVSSRDLTHQAAVAVIEPQPLMLEHIHACEPRFGPYIDRDKERSFRINDHYRRMIPDLVEAGKKSPKSPYERDGYLQAVAHWVHSLADRQTYDALDQVCQAIDLVPRYCALWLKSDDPALIWAARWLSSELKARSGNSWQRLDPVVLLLAIIARGHAHGASELYPPKDAERVVTLLRVALSACAPLLIWALAWAELMYRYWSFQRGSR